MCRASGREFYRILESRLLCGDLDSDEACFVDYEVGIGNCIELPPTVQNGLDDC